MKLRDAIERRKDVRVYDLKAPDWRAVVRAIDAARFATSAGNHFSARFILVSDEKVIKKLTDICQQSFVGKASYLVVAVSDPSGLIRSYGERGEGYCAKQIGSAVQNFLLALEEEKLVTSWVWYFDDEQVKILLHNFPKKERPIFCGLTDENIKWDMKYLMEHLLEEKKYWESQGKRN